MLRLFITMTLIFGCRDPHQGYFSELHGGKISVGRQFHLATPFTEAFSVRYSARDDSSQSFYSSGSENGFAFRYLVNKGSSQKAAKEHLISHSESFVYERPEVFGLAIGDLALAQLRFIGENEHLAVVQWVRSYQDVRVRDAFVDVYYSKRTDALGGYRLIEVHNQSFVNYTPMVADSMTDPRVYLDKLPITYEVLGDQKLWAPAADGSVRLMPSRRLEVEIEGEGLFELIFQGSDPEPLEVVKQKYSESTRLLGKAYLVNYLESSLSIFPVSNASVGVPGQPDLRASGQGVVEFEDLNDQASLILDSEEVRIIDALTDEVVSIDFRPTPGDHVLQDAQYLKALNAYLSVQRVVRFVRSYLGENSAPFLRMKANVLINVEGSCNAFYDPRLNSLNFFIEGEGCADTALINDVIYHEWGHGLDFYSGRQLGIRDGAFSEGIGDILATFLTGSSELAKGFNLGSSSSLRQIDNNQVFPRDRGPVHYEGLIISGAFWSLRVALQERYGMIRGAHMAAELFLNHLLVTDSYLESYGSVVRLDDDDGDFSTRSPNFCLITRAFAKHGLAQIAEDCVDSIDPRLPVLLDAKLEIKEDDSAPGRYLLAASLPLEERDLILCLADAPECISSSQSWQPMEIEGVTESVTRR